MKRWGYGVAVGLLVAAYLLLPLGHLGDYAKNYDEGPQLQAAALVYEGYPLYSEIVVNKPPLLSWVLALGFHLGGVTIETGRLTMLLVNLLGFVALGLLAEQTVGRGAGAVAMALLLALPETPVRSLYVMNDLPAMSMALLSLNAAVAYRRTGGWAALVASAAAYALMALFHPLLFFVGLPVWLVLFYPTQSRSWSLKEFSLKGGVWAGVAIGIVALALAAVDLQGFVRWVFGYNLSVGLTDRVSENWKTLWTYWQGLPLILLETAAVSAGMLALASRCNRLWLGMFIVWEYLTVGVLLMLRPLWPHYCIFTLYPAMVLTAGGLVTAVRRLGQQRRTAQVMPWWRWGMVGLLVVGLSGFALQRAQERLAWKLWSDVYSEAREFLEEVCEPGEFVVTDNQFLAFAAGCLVPPPLADTAGKRIETGLLRESEVVDALTRYQVRWISIGTTRLRTQLQLWSGVDALAISEHHFGRTFIYGLDRESLNPAHEQEALVGEAIRLRGYTVRGSFTPGETPLVFLYWEDIAPTPENWKVFVHLLDTSGALVAQHDEAPFMGGAATSTWQPGQQIVDPHPLELSPELPAGTYRLAVGLYRETTLERLPAASSGERWPDDVIVLTEVALQP